MRASSSSSSGFPPARRTSRADGGVEQIRPLNTDQLDSTPSCGSGPSSICGETRRDHPVELRTGPRIPASHSGQHAAVACEQQHYVHGHRIRPVQVIEYQDVAADNPQHLRGHRLSIAGSQRVPDCPLQRQALHPGQGRQAAALENPPAAGLGGSAQHRGLARCPPRPRRRPAGEPARWSASSCSSRPRPTSIR